MLTVRYLKFCSEQPCQGYPIQEPSVKVRTGKGNQQVFYVIDSEIPLTGMNIIAITKAADFQS